MKAVRTLLAVGLLGLSQTGRAQCVTSLVTVQSCTVPGGATVITDAGGANVNVNISGGTYVYTGTAGISNLSLSGGTLYYPSNGTLNGAGISGGTLIYSGTGSASGVNQNGGTVQVCGSGQLTLSGNFNAGSFVVATGGKLTFPSSYTLQNSGQLTNYGTLTFQSDLSVASGTTGVFVNAGTLTVNGQVFLNGPGFVNQGTASFGTLTVNGSGRACLSPNSTLNVTTYQTNDNANSMTVSPTTGNLACIKISNYGNFNAIMATAVPSKVGVCRVGTASASELAAYGTAQVTQNCTSCATVLPVVLVKFEARPGDAGAVQLRWRTASEVGHQGFVVERSPDGRAWTAQSPLLPGTGNSGLGADYAWADDQALAGTSYYRLRVLAQDGTAEYSPPVAVSTATRPSGSWAWVSAPEADRLRLSWVPIGLEPCGWQLLDMQGRLLRQQVEATAGTATLELAGLAPGGYWLRVQQGRQRQLLRFVRP